MSRGMRGVRPPSPRTVRRVVVASVLITALHYTDNYLYIDDYPGPDWVHREIVYIAWSLLTLIGIAGYLFYRDGRATPAGMYLLVYSYTGLSSLGHYPYGSFDDFSPRMHAFIWTDALVGAAVLACAAWILLSGQTSSAAAGRE